MRLDDNTRMPTETEQSTGCITKNGALLTTGGGIRNSTKTCNVPPQSACLGLMSHVNTMTIT